MAKKTHSAWKEFISSNVTHYIAGLIILIVGVYAIISVVSFLFTGAADQSKIEGLSLFHRGTVEGVENWTGMRGAILSHRLINDGFGFPTVFLLLFVVFVALQLMKAKRFRLVRSFIICALMTVWTSVALSFFIGRFLEGSIFYVGGKTGRFISDILIHNFGYLGSALLIVLV
ncbi:MAG: DNA translocase FtsK 4TM domain-containing protein, partial [Prevotellaceae bacterium]|nr:DNA translocase FtsK 4TM domain-containing protein [Prevotellaceae bacterium]